MIDGRYVLFLLFFPKRKRILRLPSRIMQEFLQSRMLLYPTTFHARRGGVIEALCLVRGLSGYLIYALT